MTIKTQELDEKREIAEDAKVLLNNPAFKRTTERLRKQYMDTLLRTPVGDLTVTVTHARLAALEDIIGDLQSAILDFKMASKRES